ncbi:SAM-dependent methyltransferase [Streptomyces sp. BpilaLS-43]|uniref:SAM-dependent methyltransferase n=1 Tax=Streptomyces sp. BpilaLS-43 TaxID=1839778 RepID=UPI00351DACEF
MPRTPTPRTRRCAGPRPGASSRLRGPARPCAQVREASSGKTWHLTAPRVTPAPLARDLSISQFIDLGCGLPPRWMGKAKGYDPGAPVYDAARLIHKAPRVVYVDNDPAVGGFARTMLDEHPTTATVDGDIREIDTLLNHPEIAGLDRSRRIAVLIHDLLPWMTDAQAHRVMAALREWLPPGSAISLTHATTEWAPSAMQELVDHYAEDGILYRPRSLDEITALLSPWDLLSPGIVPTGQWRGPGTQGEAHWEHSHAYAAGITNGTQESTSPTSAN